MSELSSLVWNPSVLLGFPLVLGLLGFALLSWRERERRATIVAFVLAALVAAVGLAATGLSIPVQIAMLIGLGLALAPEIALLEFLARETRLEPSGRPERRVDERDILFARARLEPGSPEFDAYYESRPEHRESDDRTRQLPGLLSPEAPLAEPVAFASAEASFAICEALRDEVDGPVAETPVLRDPQAFTAEIKRLALHHGARDVGVARLEPYHVYTHVGRGTGTWGEPIALDHSWAIAFTVEMDHQTMRTAPAAPVVAESARQYVESARLGVQLARLIRELGYPARAHIDGNYRVIAPLVAQDAGLGQIGRMGLLMTPRLGPRVRLGVVTTDLPLVADRPGDDRSVLDFCTACKKCAQNCPTQAIPFDDRQPLAGGLRWAIDADSCFRYWNAVGTDCGRCMTVCPYSHPDNPAHNLVRSAIRYLGSARRAALHLDNLFYGRRPKPLREGPTPGPPAG